MISPTTGGRKAREGTWAAKVGSQPVLKWREDKAPWCLSPPVRVPFSQLYHHPQPHPIRHQHRQWSVLRNDASTVDHIQTVRSAISAATRLKYLYCRNGSVESHPEASRVAATLSMMGEHTAGVMTPRQDRYLSRLVIIPQYARRYVQYIHDGHLIPASPPSAARESWGATRASFSFSSSATRDRCCRSGRMMTASTGIPVHSLYKCLCTKVKDQHTSLFKDSIVHK
jgi:hypothetical protein